MVKNGQLTEVRAVKAVSQPASETGAPASSVVNTSQAGSEAKSEQSQAGALSQVGSSQAVSEASSAVKDSSAAQPVVVKSMARIKAASQAQPATYRLRMAAPAVPVAAVNDHTSGTLGTSKWSIDTTTDTLTIGPGTLADTGVTADAKGEITDWKGLDWNNYQLSDPNSRLKLQLNGPVVVGKDASYLFSGLDLDDMDATKLNTQKTTNMTGMFYNAHSSGIDTKSIFNFDTSNVETMAYMFNKYVQPYSTLDISNLNTSHVADMTAMFAEMKGIQSINLSNFDTSSVTSMAQMFQQSSDLQSLDLSKFKTSEVKDMSGMFDGDTNLKELNLLSFNTSGVVSMSRMFSTLSNVRSLDLSGFDTSLVTDMSYMFSSDNLALDFANYPNFHTNNVTTMAGMFGGMYSPIKGLNKLVTNNVQDMSGMFTNANLSDADFSLFNTDSATNMDKMFHNAHYFSNSYLTNFHTNNVTSMQSMFDSVNPAPLNPGETQQGDYFTTVDLSNFNTSKVTNMSSMFANNPYLQMLDISNLDTSQVTNMSSMFAADPKLTQLDLSNFDTSNVQFMTGMFAGDEALENLNLSSFDMRSISNKLQNLGNSSWKIFMLFNLAPGFAPGFWNGEPSINTNPRVLTLGKNSRLKFNWPLNQLSDITDYPDNVNGQEITLEMIATEVLGYENVTAMKDAFTARLLPAGGPTGLWVNAGTGERLTAQELMDRYSDDQATAGTWTWQTVVGKDFQMIAHPKAEWTPADNFDQAVDDNGETIGLDKMAVTLRDATSNAIVNNIDPTKAGRYTVTYSYVGSDNVTRTSGPVALTILANQDDIKVDNIVLQLNDTFQAMVHLQGVTNADGSAVDFSNVTTSNTVDSSIPGNYTVTYQFTDLFGDVFQKTVTVVVNGLNLKQGNLNVSTDDHWDPQTNVAAAVDDTGKTVSPEQMTITMTDDAGHVVSNLKRPGQYQVSYSFSDSHGTHSQQAIVTVVAGVNHAELQLKSDHVTLYEHDEWSPLGNVSALTDSDGEPISSENWSQLLQVDGQVNTAKAGDYPVTYHFVDLFGQTHTATTLVTVKASQAGLTLKHDTVQVYAGATWEAADNLASVTDIDGSAVDPSQVTISSNVDLTKPGHYLVTYRFTDRQDKLHTATTAVIVLENQATLTLKNKDVQLTVGDAWNATDNVLQATDVDGTAVDAGKLQIDNPVLLNQPGTYLVTYQFTDQLGTVHTAQVRVVLKAKQPGDGGDDNNGQKPNPELEPTPEPTPEPIPEPTPEPNPEPAPEPKPDPVPNPEPAPENPGQQPKPTTPANPGQQPTPVTPENRPSTEHAKQNPTQRPTGDTVKVKTSYQASPIRLQHQEIKPVEPGQAAVKVETSLPQTDEQRNHRPIVGVLLLALASVGFPWFFKRQK